MKECQVPLWDFLTHTVVSDLLHFFEILVFCRRIFTWTLWNISTKSILSQSLYILRLSL